MSSLNGELCGRCGKRVYHAEAKVGSQRSWHKVGCFTCKVCNITLNSTILAENNQEKEIFCKKCYGQLFGPKGYGYGGGAGTLSMTGGEVEGSDYAQHTGPLTAAGTTYMGGNRCPRCSGSVYHAEEVKGAGLSWHKSCFTCKSCGRSLDSTICQENVGEIYCKPCYGRQFGPKGYGFGGGAGALTNTS